MFLRIIVFLYLLLMKNVRKHPVIYFSLLFVVLAAIQSHFLYNTVLLKKNEIKSKAKDLLQVKDDDKLFLTDDSWETKLFTKDFRALKDGEITIRGLKDIFKNQQDSLTPALKKFVTKTYNDTGIKIGFRKQLKSVIDANTRKVIIQNPLVIFETDPKPINLYGLSNSKWESNYSSISTNEENNVVDQSTINYKKEVQVKESFIIEQSIYYDILNMNQILFKELWGLFAVSIFIMIMVLVLYFQSYKKYNEQRKQVLLLHDTIDNISHEFKTPLATLKIASKQIQKAYSTETLTIMDRQINRLEHLLKPLNAEDFQNNHATKQQIVAFTDDYKTLYPNINWDISIETLIAELKINAADIETILGNLIDNSIKYGGKNIQLTILQNENTLKIDVIDDGIGIATTEQKYIFDKYYRVPINNIHSVKGLGVGLYLVSKIVQKYKGTIQVKSNLGMGCHLSIEL